MVSFVKIPVMDQTTETVTLTAWLAQEGAVVKNGEALCEIETEKATVEIQSPADGILRKILIEKGTEIPPRTVVALVGDATEPLPDIDPFAQTPRAQAVAMADAPKTPSTAANATVPAKLSISPRARKLAEENGIDLATLIPTGPGGRIIEEDVQTAIAARATTPTATSGQNGKTAGSSATERTARTKAERVTQSWQTIPHFYMSMTADLSAVVEAKAAAGSAVTYTDYFVQALTHTLTRHRHLNGYWKQDAHVVSDEIRIGIVVQTERGLVIPALGDVRRRTLAEISAERAGLVQAALAGKLLGDAMAEPTFTLSNVGAGSIDAFTAIISPPQLAILAVGSLMPRPVAVGDAVVVRPTATFTLGVDHRAIDGKQAAAFLQDLKQRLEALNTD